MPAFVFIKSTKTNEAMEGSERMKGPGGNLSLAGRQWWGACRLSLRLAESRGGMVGTHRNLSPYTCLDWWSQLTAVWMWNQIRREVPLRENGETANDRSLLGTHSIRARIDWGAPITLFRNNRPNKTFCQEWAIMWYEVETIQRDKSHSQWREGR